MLNNEALVLEINTKFKPEYVPLLISHLESEGFTAQEILDLDSTIQVFSEDLPTQEMTDNLTKVEQEIAEESSTSFASDAMIAESTTKEIESKTNLGEHETFNAETTLTLPEPKFSEPNKTSPVDQLDYDYSLDDDYPDSYGFIDDAKNWVKVNNVKKTLELVTSSGTRIKVNKTGDVTLYTSGSFKHIVDGDYSLEVRGSMDTLITGDSYTHIKGSQDSLVDKAVTWDFKNSLDHTVTSAVTSTYKSSFDLTVSSGVKMTSGAMFEITAALLLKNSASMILLN